MALLRIWLFSALALSTFVAAALYAQSPTPKKSNIAKASATPSDSPAKKKKASPSAAKKTSKKKSSPSSKKSSTPGKGESADEDDAGDESASSAKKSAKKSASPSEAKKAKKSPTPSKKKKKSTSSSKKKKKTSSSKKKKTATPKRTATPSKAADLPFDEPPLPSPAATPAVAASRQQFQSSGADITIEKSGLQEDEGFMPPPPSPTPRRGFWSLFSRRRQPTTYRYLNRSVIEAIRRAPVRRGRWKIIAVHNSGSRQGNAKVFDYYHRRVKRMRNGMAYHFVVGNGTSTGNGQIEIGSRWHRQINGGHVHSDYLNNISLGICLVGDFNRHQPTRAQLEATEELIRYLRERCGKSEGRILVVRPHKAVNPPRWPTDCPGDAFPYGWFGRFR